MRRYILTITCPDRIGIVAAVTGLIAGLEGSVLEAAQHGDLEAGSFFLRIEILADSLPDDFGPDDFAAAFEPLAREFDMAWHLADTDRPKRAILFVSKEDHCLADLLQRWRAGELECELPAVISNHEDLRSLVEWHGVAFHHVPVPPSADDADGTGKAAAFEEMDRIVRENRADVLVLARYMQVLPASFCADRLGRIINIHHSFLPSFAGARPYHQAHQRGVKLIGATCHYVTADLDEGPIIEQDTRRIDHGDSVDELRRVGRDVERTVLARGLRWHLEDRVLLNGHKTVVFP
ncbi:MAG TPA: formyltetrahydrofolate deformylase [Acidimicrobiales bacterium]|nr:formyltetrahydrofolate deformylase [Acidimicrobiales bacterium]